MTSRVEQLAARRRLLLARSAIERETLRMDAAAIGDTLHAVDRAVALVQRLRRSTWLLTAAVAGLVIFRRHPVTAWVMRGLAVAGTARRIGAAVGRLATQASAQEAGSR